MKRLLLFLHLLIRTAIQPLRVVWHAFLRRILRVWDQYGPLTWATLVEKIRGLQWSLPKVGSFAFGAMGGLFFLLGLLLPWMVAPMGVDVNEKLLQADAPVTPLWKLVVILAVMLGMFWEIHQWRFRRKKANGSRVIMVAAATIPWLLAFPQAVIVGCSEYSGEICWLQQQHDNLTWLGGDVYMAHTNRYQPGGLPINVQDTPVRLAAFRPPLVAPWSLGIAEIPDLLWWYGYNPAFCQFVAKGWFLCIFGLIFLIVGWLGLQRRDDETGSRVHSLSSVAAAFFLALTTTLSLGLIPSVGAAYFIKKSRRLAIDADVSPARQDLLTALRFMPALKFDTGVMHQMGVFDRRMGNTTTPEARLWQAQLSKIEGYSLQARQEIRALANLPLSRALAREVSRTMLRFCMDDINTNRNETAKRELQMLCDREPSAIQPRFHLQLVALKTGDHALNRRCALQLKTLYGPFLRKEKKGVIAASMLMLAQSEMELGDVNEAALAREESR